MLGKRIEKPISVNGCLGICRVCSGLVWDDEPYAYDEEGHAFHVGCAMQGEDN